MAANINLINNVLSLTVQMAAELGLDKTKFTLEHVETMRAKVRKDHWNTLLLLANDDEIGRHIANSVISHLFRLAFSNVKVARIDDTHNLEIILSNGVTLHVTDPAQREQEELIW